MKEEVKLRRPSIVATLLWVFGMFIIGLTVCSLVFWEGGLTTVDLHGSLLIFVAFSSGINAIATGALIDMHTMRYTTGNKAHRKHVERK